MHAAFYRLIHETHYSYVPAVTHAYQLAHLTPRTTDWQTLHAHTLGIEPPATERTDDDDFFGNRIARFSSAGSFDAQVICANSIVEVRPHAPAADTASPDWRSVREACATAPAALQFELAQFISASAMAPILAEAAQFAHASLHAGGPWLKCLLGLTKRIHEEFVFDSTATTLTTPVQEVLEKSRGVCQDFAHLMVSCLRSVGLPARYVSGYILTHPPEGQPRLIGADASHAWVSAYCPEFGWVDFDPTNGKLADTEFVTLGWGRDFLDVTPLRGVVLGSGTQDMEVRVTMQPIAPDTRLQDASSNPEPTAA